VHVCYTQWGLGAVTAIECQGDYCDNIRVECGAPWQWGGPEGAQMLTLGSCYWTSASYSEEPPSSVNFSGFIAGVLCEGDYCDNKRFLVCRSIDAP
jgi:hypothetical protein